MAQNLTVAEIIRLRWREEFEREADTTDEHVRYYEELEKLDCAKEEDKRQ